jgi:hypothetical protein
VCHDYGVRAADGSGREPRCQTSIGEQKRDNIHVHDGTSEAAFIAMRTTRDATLAEPALLLPALRVNLRGGVYPGTDNPGA